MAGTRREYHFEKEFPKSADKAPFVEKLWATRKVAWLLDQIRQAGESKEVKAEIEELALRYSIVTPFTSYLAMKDEASVSQPGRRRSSPVSGEDKRVRHYQHNNSPSSRNAMSGVSAASKTMDFKAESGAGAVQTAQRLRALKTAEIVIAASPADQDTLQKTVGGKNFINANGIWKDTAITGTEKKIIKVRCLSDGWFQLSEDFPHLRDYFSIGDRIQVLLPKNIVLHVGPEGLDAIEVPTKELIQSALVEIN